MSRYPCANIRHVAYHAVNECELQPGQWLAVIGCGGLGLLAIQYAKAMGLKVVGIDINDTILAGAKAAGADLTYNSMTNATYAEELKMATDGGAHAAAVFAGSKPAYDGAPNVLRMNGLIMAIGLMSKPLEINSIAFMRGLFRIKSTATGPPHKMPKAVEFTAKHNITSQVGFYKLEQINEMIESMKSGKSTGRMVVLFE
jgi:propanol-preferring alcohol dehydrogenase